MKLMLLFSIVYFFTFSVFAQINPLWEKTKAANDLPSWFSETGNSERGFTYNPQNDQLYVVSRNGGTFVRIMNAQTGADAGQLDVTGITNDNSTFPLNDIGASADGKLFACNLAIGTGQEFRLYRWDSDAAAPVLAFASTFGGLDKRLGDRMTVAKSASDNSLEVWLTNPTAQKIYILKTNNNGQTLFFADSIVLPAATLGSVASVYPVFQHSIFVLNSAGRNATVWSFSGQLLGQIPGGIISTGTTTITMYVDMDNTYLVTYQYGGGAENARIVDVTSEDPANARTYTLTPILGTNGNGNGTGDLAIKFNSDGSQVLFVLGTNNGIAAYNIVYPGIVNGRFNEHYITAAEKLNNNQGFGPNIDIESIRTYLENGVLYIAIKSKLNRASSDGIAIFLGLSNLSGTGISAGQALGGVPSGGHLFGNSDNPNFANDFETHFGIVLNPGGGDTLVYVDAVRYQTGNKIASYLGAANQAGFTQTGPEVSGVFSENSVMFAFDTAFGGNRGFEIAIPFTELGNAGSTDNVKLFALVTSSTAYFSDVTVPGNITSGNLGFNPNFNSLGGGPFNTGSIPLPVELTAFSATPSGNSVTLEWSTASELNNQGFFIQRSINGSDFIDLTFIDGKGTTTNQTNYAYVDENLYPEKYYYRLKQIDFDGTYKFSKTIEVIVLITPDVFELSQNYPNPFNPSTSIKFVSGSNERMTLKIYNLVGQEIALLFNEAVDAGKVYEITFDAANLTSGVYFYSLTQGSRVETKKMILLR